MIATVDIADVGRAATVRALLRRPMPADQPGLLWSEAVALAPLAATRPPSLRRAAVLAFWTDDEAAAARQPFAAGFHARLRPLRAFGDWPGLPPDLSRDRAAPSDGPVVVFTLGRLRVSQVVRFLRTSRPAEKAAVAHDGLLWGTAAARPPFVATVSMWADGAAAATYAYGRRHPEHSEAIAAQLRKDFHRRSAFIRFEPIHAEGMIDGVDPLARRS